MAYDRLWIYDDEKNVINMINELILTNLGLSPNEAKIYLAALEMGTSSAQMIAQKARLKRTTGYSILDELVKKGFVLKTQQKGKTKFLAEHPRNITEKFKTYQKSLENSLPELEAIYNKKKIKPKVLYFEGEEGIKKIYEDTLADNPKEILEFNTSEIFAFGSFPFDYVAERSKRQIEAIRIAPDDENYRRHQRQDQQENATTKLVPTDKYNIPIEINVYNNKVAFMSYADKIGLIIESEGIAKSMKQIYQLLWEKLK